MKFSRGIGLSINAHDQEAVQLITSHKMGDIIEFWVVQSQDPTGTQTMLNTWMMWMGETAKWMSGRGASMPLFIDKEGNHHGRREFKKEDAHDLFTSKYLGVDENGKRKTWGSTKNPNEIKASTGDKLHCMNFHMEWSIEKGLKLTVKQDSEFMKLNAEQG